MTDPRRRRRRNHRLAHSTRPTSPPPASSKIWLWLSPPIGAAIVVAVCVAGPPARATPEILIVASVMFSVCEGVVLAFVGYAWSRRGILGAVFAGAGTAAVAAPARWELSLLRNAQPVPQSDLLSDLVVSLTWGAL